METSVTLVGITLVGLGLMRLRRYSEKANSPTTVLLIGLGLVITAYYHLGFSYRDTPSFYTWCIYISMTLLTVVGALSGEFLASKLPLIRTPNLNPLNGFLIRTVTFITIAIGGFAVLCQVAHYGPLLIRSDLETFRNIINSGEESAGILPRIGRLSLIHLLGLTLLLRCEGYFSRNIRLSAGLLCIVLTMLAALFSGGRWPVIVMAIIFLFSKQRSLTGIRQDIKKYWLIVLLLAGYLFILPFFRNSQSDTLQHFIEVFNIEYQHTGSGFLERAPRGLTSTYLNIAVYTTSGISYLENFLSHRMESHYGILHFGWIYRIVGIATWNEYGDAKAELRSGLKSEDRFAEIWGTGLQEPIFDFGLTLASAFLFLIGFIVGWQYVAGTRRPSPVNDILYPVALVIFVFVPMSSPIQNPFFQAFFNASIFIYLVTLLFWRNRPLPN